MSELELELTPGWCAQEVADELPGLRLLSAPAQVRRVGSLAEASPAGVLARLREKSNRFRGANAVAVRREPVPSAYRVFFRQIGLDPEVMRTPLEAAVLDRMMKGGFLSGGLLEDILLLSLLDTGVPLWALDAQRIDGPLGIRVSEHGEQLGGSATGESGGRDAEEGIDGGTASQLPAGRLVVADASTPLAVLFGELSAAHVPSVGTQQLTLFAVQVAGVPELYAEEALWSACTAFAAA